MAQSDADQFLAQLEAEYAGLLSLLQTQHERDAVLQSATANVVSTAAERDSRQAEVDSLGTSIATLTADLSQLQNVALPSAQASLVNAVQAALGADSALTVAQGDALTAAANCEASKARVAVLRDRVKAEIDGDFPT